MIIFNNPAISYQGISYYILQQEPIWQLSKEKQEDREFFSFGLNLAYKISDKVQFDMYSHLVYATMDPRNSFQNVQELLRVKKAYEKYAAHVDSDTFQFRQLIKKYSGKVKEFYSERGNPELSASLELSYKAITELSKIKNPTLEEEQQIMAKVYNKSLEDVQKDYSNPQNIPKYRTIKRVLIFNDILAETPLSPPDDI